MIRKRYEVVVTYCGTTPELVLKSFGNELKNLYCLGEDLTSGPSEYNAETINCQNNT
jgi:hypothetical protein